MTQMHENIVGLDSAVFMHPKFGKQVVTLMHSMILLLTTKTQRRDTVQTY